MARKGSGGRVGRGKPMKASLRTADSEMAQGGMSEKSPIAAESQLGELLAAIWEIYDLDEYAVFVQRGSVYKCPIGG